MQVSGFFDCTCGKSHTLADVSITSQCTCGAFLYPQVSTEATQRVAAVLVKGHVPYNW
jgi:hypothetical protein